MIRLIDKRTGRILPVKNAMIANVYLADENFCYEADYKIEEVKSEIKIEEYFDLNSLISVEEFLELNPIEIKTNEKEEIEIKTIEKPAPKKRGRKKKIKAEEE